MICAGMMDRRITLQSPTTSRGTDGSVTLTYADTATVWAELVSQAGKEFYQAQKVNAEVTAVFRCRHRSGVNTTWKIKMGARTFDIKFVDDTKRRGGEMLIACREVV